MTASARRALLAAALLLAAAWWALRLWGDLPGRAFDPSDPAAQLAQAQSAAARLESDGVRGWMADVISDPGAKPAQAGQMSLALSLGLPPSPSGYAIFCGFWTLLLFSVIEAAVWRARGPGAGLLFAAFSLGSNALLGQALYGGHSWPGQVFLWLAASLWLSQGPPLSWRRAAAFGIFLSLSVLASYHMAPLAAALAAAWTAAYAEDCVRRRKAGAAGPLFALALVALPALFEAATWTLAKPHYWQTLLWQAQDAAVAARAIAPGFRPGWSYFWDFLRSAEGPVFALAVLILALVEAGALAPGVARDPRRWPWLILPAAGLTFACAPGLVKLGRVCLPALVALLPLAAMGADRLASRITGRSRAAAVAAFCVVLLWAGAARRERTWRAFHAGRDIEAAIESRGGAGPPIVIGLSLPFAYGPGPEVRVQTMAGLRQAVRQGRDWLLVSDLSAWWWLGFMGRRKFDIPVVRVLTSRAPYVEVPGVESSWMQPFTNEVQYELIRTGRLPFPVPNRLYRARDFLAAAQGPRPGTARSNTGPGDR